MANRPKRRFEPSRMVVNLGVVVGGVVGLVLTTLLERDAFEAFLLTGFCALMGVALFGYTEVFVVRRGRG